MTPQELSDRLWHARTRNQAGRHLVLQ